MLEKVDLNLSLPKKEYKTRMEVLGERLTLLQRACWENRIPVIILFEGWDASGKGTTINLLARHMDPRGFKIQPIKGASEHEREMPWLWRFWQRLPNYGEIGIFDRSWYGRVMVERVEKMVPPVEWRQAYQDILEFERQLAEDGYLLIKFFLHISMKEQQRRFKKIEKDPLQDWRVQKEDWKHHKKYDEYREAVEEMLARTETEWGPWTIVEATDRYYAWVKIFETTCRWMEDALTRRGLAVPELISVSEPAVESGETAQEVAHA